MMSFGDQILQYVTDETKLRAPWKAWPDDRRCEPRVEVLCGSPRNAALFNGKYHPNGGNVRQGRHQPENPRQPFTKCLVDISENLFANIVWPVDTAVAPELAGGVVFFSCLSATEHISGSFAAPQKP